MAHDVKDRTQHNKDQKRMNSWRWIIRLARRHRIDQPAGGHRHADIDKGGNDAQCQQREEEFWRNQPIMGDEAQHAPEFGPRPLTGLVIFADHGGFMAREMAGGKASKPTQPSLRGAEGDAATQSHTRGSGLLRFARNDGG